MKEIFESALNIIISPKNTLNRERFIQRINPLPYIMTFLLLRFIFSTLAYVLLNLNSLSDLNIAVLIYSGFTSILYFIFIYYAWIVGLFILLKIRDKKVTFKEASQYILISRTPSLLIGILPFSFFYGVFNILAFLIYIYETYLFVLILKTIYKSKTLNAIGYYVASGLISALFISLLERPISYLLNYLSIYLF